MNDRCKALSRLQILPNPAANQLLEGVLEKEDAGKGDKEVCERLDVVGRNPGAGVVHPFLVPQLHLGSIRLNWNPGRLSAFTICLACKVEITDRVDQG